MLEDNEVRFVHREETFNDLAVRELAKSRALCLCRLQYKHCKRAQCKHCSSLHRYNNCISQMSDFDKERLRTYIAAYYNEYNTGPGKWLPFGSLIIYCLKYAAGFIFLIAIICAFLTAIGCSHPQAGPDRQDYVPADLDYKIVRCIQYSHRYMHDINRDRKINCIDYTVLFKYYWDILYPDYKSQCEIVRNKRPAANLHHLFIVIYFMNGRELYVEPWTTVDTVYQMRDNWTSRWNPRYNIYGETDYWMRELID